jgi:hypothetical protein
VNALAPYVIIVLVLAAAIGVVTATALLKHAKSNLSPESASRVKLHRGSLAYFGLVLLAGAMAYPKCATMPRWVVIFLAAVCLITLYQAAAELKMAVCADKRLRQWVRWGDGGFLLALALFVCGGGCAVWHGTYTRPDGVSVDVGGMEFLTKKSVGAISARNSPTTQEFNLSDLERTGDVEMVRAAAEGAVSAGIKAAVKP